VVLTPEKSRQKFSYLKSSPNPRLANNFHQQQCLKVSFHFAVAFLMKKTVYNLSAFVAVKIK